jgi:hypothetical protein
MKLTAFKDRGAISQELATRILELLKAAPLKTLAPRFLKLAIENLSALWDFSPPPIGANRAGKFLLVPCEAFHLRSGELRWEDAVEGIVLQSQETSMRIIISLPL